MCGACKCNYCEQGNEPPGGASFGINTTSLSRELISSSVNEIRGLSSGYSWNTDADVEIVTYTYDSKEGNWADKGDNYQLFNAAQRAAADAVFEQYENVANIKFVNTGATSPEDTDITLRTADMHNGMAGFAYFPYRGHSDVSIDKIYGANGSSSVNAVEPGGFGFLLLLHEIGHALGLDHPHEGAGILSNSLDNVNTTVMSYNSSNGSSAGGYVAARGGDNTPQTLQILDILTLQYLYGVNSNYNSGNDVYDLTGEAKVFTIWDGNGSDTLNSTSYFSNVTLDLREGLENISEVGGTKVWNAFGANIENATSGTGNDVLYGNDLANMLYAGAGKDNIYGGEGNDIVQGNAGRDIIFGDDGNDFIRGGKDDDNIYGGNGRDTLAGDMGDDILSGGNGSDVFVFAVPVGQDTIKDFVSGEDIIQISSSVIGSAKDAFNSTTFSGNNAVVDLGSGDSVTLVGVGQGQLSESDFIVV